MIFRIFSFILALCILYTGNEVQNLIHHINPAAASLTVPGIRIFANKVAEFEDGINLTIGQPDFPTPENVKEAGISAIRENRTGYSHNAGLPALRKSVSNFFRDAYRCCYDPDSEIVITNGASEALDSVLRTIMVEGDEVILPSPSYSGYEPLIRLNGGTPVHLDTTESGFIPDPDALSALINDNTKAVLFNYPSNPTGVSLPYGRMEKLADMLAEKDIFIISDEIYSENTFMNKHISFGTFENIHNRLFIIHGLSKSHAMTGWRIGYVLGPKTVMEHVLKVHLNNSICASLPSQYAAIEALDHTRGFPHEMNTQYVERRDYTYRRLENMGLTSKKPAGAFYIFPDISATGMDDVSFTTKLLEEEHVAVVPGSTFSKNDHSRIRISYASSLDNLAKGMDRMEHFIARQKS